MGMIFASAESLILETLERVKIGEPREGLWWLLLPQLLVPAIMVCHVTVSKEMRRSDTLTTKIGLALRNLTS